MSAFVVSDKHIDALLTWAQNRQFEDTPAYYVFEGKMITFWDNLDRIGQVLLDQNFASVNHRYTESEVPPLYFYKPYYRQLTPVQVIKACDCYKYQSCENPEHEETEAWAIIENIRERAIHALPGYETADWEITE